MGKEKIDPDDLATVWRNAEHRRAEDVTALLREILQEWSRPRSRWHRPRNRPTRSKSKAGAPMAEAPRT